MHRRGKAFMAISYSSLCSLQKYYLDARIAAHVVSAVRQVFVPDISDTALSHADRYFCCPTNVNVQLLLALERFFDTNFLFFYLFI